MRTMLERTASPSSGRLSRQGKRTAFTLMEVLIASLISLLLLGALYVAVNMQLRHEQTAREIVQESTLARALFSRITSDISQNVDPYLPPAWAIVNGTSTGSGSGGAGSGANGSGSGASGSGSSGSNTSSGSNSANSSAGSSSPTSSSPTSSISGLATNSVVYNVGIQGDDAHLLLCVSRLPRDLMQMASPTNAPADQTVVSDLRRVAYWLVSGNDTTSGLARLEIKQATSDDALNLMSNLPDDPALVMAAEVKSLTFSYFDGTNWNDTWDGTTPGADGVTPIGPPVAIAITLGIANANGQGVKTYRHVVLIPTANGTPASTTGTAAAGPTG